MGRVYTPDRHYCHPERDLRFAEEGAVWECEECGAQLRWDDTWGHAMGTHAQGHARGCKRSSPVLYVNLFPGAGA